MSVTLLIATRTAAAESEQVALQFRADADCPSEEDFRKEVLSRTREVRFDDDHAARVLEVSAGIVGSRAWGTLRFHRPGESGASRLVEDKNCADVVSALALMVVLAVDPGAPMAPITEPGGEPAAPPAPTPSPRASPATELRPPADRPAIEASSGSLVGLDVIAMGEAVTPDSPNLTLNIGAAMEIRLEAGLRPALRIGGRLGTSLQAARGPGAAEFHVSALSLEASCRRDCHLSEGSMGVR